MTELRVGVIGVGHLGKEHARIVSGLAGVVLAGVADVNATQAEAVARRCGTRAYTDYRPLLDQIDAAVIAVPTSRHYEVAAEVLRRGIPALVEKPLAATHEQAVELLTLSRAHGALLQVGHIERFNPAFEAVQNRPLIPKYIFAERLGGYTGRSTDVGVVLDLMIHDLDLILALTYSPATRVEALGISVLGGPEDMATARITFASGCVADVRASRLAAAPLRRMQIWGAAGFASIDFAGRRLTLVQPSSDLLRHRNRECPLDAAVLAGHFDRLELNGDGRDQLTSELAEFVRCVQTGARPRVAGEEGCAAMALAGRVLTSIQEHAWDGAARMLVGPNALVGTPDVLFQPQFPGLAA